MTMYCEVVTHQNSGVLYDLKTKTEGREEYVLSERALLAELTGDCVSKPPKELQISKSKRKHAGPLKESLY